MGIQTFKLQYTYNQKQLRKMEILVLCHESNQLPTIPVPFSDQLSYRDHGQLLGSNHKVRVYQGQGVWVNIGILRIDLTPVEPIVKRLKTEYIWLHFFAVAPGQV